MPNDEVWLIEHFLQYVEISSPLGARLEFSESELFPDDALQNSEVASISSNNNNNNANKDYNNTTTLLDHRHNDTTPPAATTGKDNNNDPLFFEDDVDDHLDNNNVDISSSIDFTPSSPSFSLPRHHHQYFNNNNDDNDDHNNNNNNNNEEILFSMSSMYNNDNNIQISSSGGETYQYNIPERPLIRPTAYNNNNSNEEISGFMSSAPLPSYYNSNIDPMINIGNYLPFSFDVFAAGNGLFLGNDVSAHHHNHHHHHQELELQQGDNIGGIFHPDSAIARVFNYSTADLQVVSSEGQHQLLHGSPGATLEISSLEDPNFKVAKLSVEERKRKIHRYLKKRNERNFSKKIKYACRKTLADSRPRVRGRFAKNDELAEARTGAGTGTGHHNHEDDCADEDGGCLFSNPTPHLQHNKGLRLAEEELEASDIFAHISGVNSFKCNYPIQSWI